MGHKCKELDLANTSKEKHCDFTIVYTSWYYSELNSDKPKRTGESTWKLVNNEDDYYSPPYINYCPFCGKKLDIEE